MLATRGFPTAEPSAADERRAWRDYVDILATLETVPPIVAGEPGQNLVRHTVTALVQQRLAALTVDSPLVRTFIESSLAAFNGVPGNAASFDRLHELLEQQPYRLAHWKTAFDEINYRRFFDVNDLGAIRMEDPRVFNAAHRRVLQLIADHRVTGLRIDHPDGLLDPGRAPSARAR